MAQQAADAARAGGAFERYAGLDAPAVARAQRAAVALGSHRLDEAERELAALAPTTLRHPEMLRLLGTVRLLRGRCGDAIAALTVGCALRPHDPLLFAALGGAHERVGDYSAALEASARACALGPDIAACWSNRARLLRAVGDRAGSAEALARVLALEPGHVNAQLQCADALQAEGRHAEAAAAYRDVARRHPDRAGLAWWGLACLRPLPFDGTDIDAMRAALARPGAGRQHYVAINFALAHALEQHGDMAAAWTALSRAHALAQRDEPWDATAFSNLAAALRATPPAHASGDGAASAEAIFIVSLPRSGSTLLEQILASQSAVAAGGETPLLRQLLLDAAAGARRDLAAWQANAGAADWQALGERYRAQTRPWRGTRALCTDKMPGNWLFIGAILAMLPRARVIVLRRDPLETTLGCYRTYFTSQAYAHAFEDLAAYWRDFDRTTRYWCAQAPQRVCAIDYETLVDAPQHTIPALLEFCGLPFEAACLTPHTTVRRIDTPSAGQVRQPIHAPVRRAHAYAPWIEPLRQALAGG